MTEYYYFGRKVDDRIQQLIGVPGGLAGLDETGSLASGLLPPVDTDAIDARITAAKGVAGGIAPLDGSGKIDSLYLPSSSGSGETIGTYYELEIDPYTTGSSIGNYNTFDETGQEGPYVLVGSAGTNSTSQYAVQWPKAIFAYASRSAIPFTCIEKFELMQLTNTRCVFGFSMDSNALGHVGTASSSGGFAMFRYADGDTNWNIIIGSGSVDGATTAPVVSIDTGIAVTTSAVYMFKIEFHSYTDIRYFINDQLVYTQTSNFIAKITFVNGQDVYTLYSNVRRVDFGQPTTPVDILKRVYYRSVTGAVLPKLQL